MKKLIQKYSFNIILLSNIFFIGILLIFYNEITLEGIWLIFSVPSLPIVVLNIIEYERKNICCLNHIYYCLFPISKTKLFINQYIKFSTSKKSIILFIVNFLLLAIFSIKVELNLIFVFIQLLLNTLLINGYFSIMYNSVKQKKVHNISILTLLFVTTYLNIIIIFKAFDFFMFSPFGSAFFAIWYGKIPAIIITTITIIGLFLIYYKRTKKWNKIL